MEQDDLAISSTDADLVVSDCLDALDTLCTDRLTEDKHLVLHLIRAEISRGASNKHEFFIWLGESNALVVSYHSSSLHHLV